MKKAECLLGGSVIEITTCNHLAGGGLYRPQGQMYRTSYVIEDNALFYKTLVRAKGLNNTLIRLISKQGGSLDRKRGVKNSVFFT